MATGSYPVGGYLATLVASVALQQSTQATVTCNIQRAIEAVFNLRAGETTVSADPVIDVYRSMDGGTNWDTTPFASFGVPRNANAVTQKSIRLPGGIYCFRITASGPNTQTFAFLTGDVVSYFSNG